MPGRSRFEQTVILVCMKHSVDISPDVVLELSEQFVRIRYGVRWSSHRHTMQFVPPQDIQHKQLKPRDGPIGFVNGLSNK